MSSGDQHSCQWQTTTFSDTQVQLCPKCGKINASQPNAPQPYYYIDYIRHLEEEIQLEQKRRQKPLDGLINSAEYNAHYRNYTISVTVHKGSPAAYRNIRDVDITLPAGDDEEKLSGIILFVSGKNLKIRINTSTHIASHQPIQIQPSQNDLFPARMRDTLAEISNFEHIIDPFFDASLWPKVGRKKLPDHMRKKIRNPKQIKAVESCLAVPEGGIYLVQGPPGTGKTVLISQIVKEISKDNQTVLITSNTHSAIDNALEKIASYRDLRQYGLVRIGSNKEQVSPVLERFVQPGSMFWLAKNRDGKGYRRKRLFSSFYHERKIVGMTLDSLLYYISETISKDDIYPFDWVIVDEAGMNLLPKIAAARMAGKRVILVGDHQQLPPIVQTPTYSKKPGFNRSYFETLWHQRPDLGTTLTHQFRSVPEIVSWVNPSVYHNNLTSARPSYPRKLRLFGNLITKPVIWLDTKRHPETKHNYHQRSYRNPGHLGIAYDVIQQMLRQTRYGEKDIAYISPFVPQANSMQQILAHPSTHSELDRIGCGTVDRFQGREYPIVIYDLTTTDPTKSHQSINRLNVALTRARDYLIIIGPREYVKEWQQNPYYYSFQNWDEAVNVPINWRLSLRRNIETARRIINEK